jgi:hypothetical protein
MIICQYDTQFRHTPTFYAVCFVMACGNVLCRCHASSDQNCG